MFSILSDHSDFKTTSRALLVAAVSLFVVCRLNILSDSIEIFGLKLGVDKTELIWFARAAVVYFLYQYFWRVLEKVRAYRLDMLKLEFENEGSYNKVGISDSRDFQDIEAENEMRMLKRKLSYIEQRTGLDVIEQFLSYYAPVGSVAIGSILYSFYI